MPRRSLPIRIIRRIARHPVMVVSLASIGVRMGKDAYKAKNGSLTWGEFRVRAGGHVGSVGGGVAGAAAGAAAGSFFPGVGTLIGGFAGSLVGEAGGTKLGRKVVETVEDRVGGKKSRDPDLETPKREL